MSKNNKVELTGFLGADPKLVQTADKCFAAFSIATKDRYQDKNEEWKDRETIWHRCIVFNPNLVDLSQKMKKGMRIKVRGELSYRSFDALVQEDKTIKKQEATIVVQQLENCPLFER